MTNKVSWSEILGTDMTAPEIVCAASGDLEGWLRQRCRDVHGEDFCPDVDFESLAADLRAAEQAVLSDPATLPQYLNREVAAKLEGHRYASGGVTRDGTPSLMICINAGGMRTCRVHRFASVEELMAAMGDLPVIGGWHLTRLRPSTRESFREDLERLAAEADAAGRPELPQWSEIDEDSDTIAIILG